jgi:hypothetical protein
MSVSMLRSVHIAAPSAAPSRRQVIMNGACSSAWICLGRHRVIIVHLDRVAAQPPLPLTLPISFLSLQLPPALQALPPAWLASWPPLPCWPRPPPSQRCVCRPWTRIPSAASAPSWATPSARPMASLTGPLTSVCAISRFVGGNGRRRHFMLPHFFSSVSVFK